MSLRSAIDLLMSVFFLWVISFGVMAAIHLWFDKDEEIDK